MTTTITATQAKAELLAIIDRVANGTSGPVIVTKHGKARVRIVPVVDEGKALDMDTFFGWAKGNVTIPEGLDLTAPVWGDDWIEARDGDEAPWLE